MRCLLCFLLLASIIIPLSCVSYFNLFSCNQRARVLSYTNTSSTFKTTYEIVHDLGGESITCNVTVPNEDDGINGTTPSQVTIYYQENNPYHCCANKHGDYIVGLTTAILNACVGYVFLSCLIQYCFANYRNSQSTRVSPDSTPRASTIALSQTMQSSPPHQEIVMRVFELHGDSETLQFQRKDCGPNLCIGKNNANDQVYIVVNP